MSESPVPGTSVRTEPVLADAAAIRPPFARHVRGPLARFAWGSWFRGAGVLGIVLFLAGWELFARHLDQGILLVPPSAVAEDLWTWISSGEIGPHLRTSGLELAIGFGLGLVAGVVLGIAMGLVVPLRRLLQPLVVGMYSTPVLALAPLFIIWLGFGLSAKFSLIALTAVFPILVNVEAGITSVDHSFLDVARSFGASPLSLIAKVRIPASLPFLFAGMRIAIARAVTGVFVAELFGSTAGIGYTIQNASSTFHTARLFSGIVVLAASGILMTSAVSWLGRLMTPWQASNQVRQ
jgi:NitT/TauT family transport system permease protein